MNVAIIMMAKNEELYLDEWFLYYKNLGINQVYFLDNNEKQNDAQLEIAKRFNSFVTYIDIRDVSFLELHKNIQIYFYEKVYKEIHKRHDWILFLDADEFLFLDSPLNFFFSKQEFTDTPEILFNWKCYGDSNLIRYDKRPVQTRFTIPYDNEAHYSSKLIENGIVKCAVNCKYEIKNHEIHTANINGKAKNALGEDCVCGWYQLPPIHEVAYIKHYETKTIEEFLSKRLIGKRTHNANAQLSKEELLTRFFNVNKRTKEKEEFIEKFITASGDSNAN